MKDKKNVLLISYYWRPSGGAGVLRWLRFSKYFKENGANLTVYCPEDAAWPAIDSALNEQVSDELTIIRRKIFEPHKFLGKGGQKGVGFSQQQKPGLVQRFIIWVRGNLFIPDSRVFWINPSTRFLTKYLNEHPEIDTIISTGPPHSMHVIAAKLKKKLNIKWIADFRDPWTEIDFYKDLNLGKRADEKQKRLEKLCLTQADEVVTVSNSCAEGLAAIGNRKIHVVTNGYEFPSFDTNSIQLDEEFSIVHLGSMPFARNPKALWKTLESLLQETPQLKEKLCIKLIGSVDYKVLESAEKHGLNSYIKIIPPVDHASSIKLQRQAQLLLLSANNSGNVKGILTGKFFEYLGAKRPIIAIGDRESDLEAAMNSTDAGCFESFEGSGELKKYLAEAFEKFLSGNLKHEPINTDQYSSQRLAKKIINLI